MLDLVVYIWKKRGGGFGETDLNYYTYKLHKTTGHYNLAYFQSKINPEIDPTCRLCLQANETLHLKTDSEATASLQMDIMKNQILLRVV